MANNIRIDTYCTIARNTAVYHKRFEELGLPTFAFTYPILGLTGEYGETVDEIFPNHGGMKIKAPVRRLMDELGDVLWYVVNTAMDLNIHVSDLADMATGGLRTETFEELCFQRLKPRDTRSPWLKITMANGQLAEVAKKAYRDGYDVNTMSTAKRAVCVSALVSNLVSMCEICEKWKICLGEVAHMNNTKLTSRKNRGKLKGDGDDR